MQLWILQIIVQGLLPEISCNWKHQGMLTWKIGETWSNWDNSQCPWKTFMRSDGNFRQKRKSIKFSHQSLTRAKFRDKLQSLNVIQTDSKNDRSPNAPPYDQRSTEWNEKQEKFARHKAYNLHKELFKKKGSYYDVHRTNFFRSYVPTKAKNTATSLTTHSKEMIHRVDCDASWHMMGLSFLNNKGKKTVRRSRKVLDMYTASDIVVSDTQAKNYIKELDAYLWHIWRKIHHQCYRWEDYVTSFVIFIARSCH